MVEQLIPAAVLWLQHFSKYNLVGLSELSKESESLSYIS